MAGPITAAVTAIVLHFGGSAALATTLSAITVTAAKFVATTALSAALSDKPKISSGTALDFKADLDAGLPIALGRTATAGNLVFQYPHGKKNRFLNLFCILSACGPIAGIDSFYGDEQLATFSTAGVVTNAPSWKDQMFQTTRLGAVPDTALPQPGGQATADGTFGYWTSAHKLSGYACAWWSVQYDSDKLNALPKPRWVLRGTKVYDPRLDSTYPGGSGSQRSDNPASWVYSENPYLHGLTWCIGYWQNGKRVAGVGAPIAAIDVPAFVNGANIADAHGWKVGGMVSTTHSKWQVLKSILQAGAGEPTQLGAKISCTVSAPKTSLATLTSNDLAGAPTLQAMMSRRDRINTVVARYRSEAHGWEQVAANPIAGSTYVTEDGGSRTREISYDLVQQAGQVGQLAAYDVVNSREFQPITLPVKPRWLGYQPGDCLTVTIAELGLNGQKVVILKRTSPDPQTGIVTLTLRSETDAKHAFALGTSAVAPPTPGLSAPDFATVDAPALGQWVATATAQVGGGASVPCIALTGDATDYPFASSIIVEYRLHGATDWLMWGSSPATSTTITIAGLGGAQSYDVAISYKSVYGVTGARRVLGPVTTLAGYGVASSILNQGALATSNNVTYGDGTIKETAGGSTATLLNFKTPLGTAAAFTGQGALATQNSLGYGSSFLTGFGALASLASLNFGSANFLEASGGAIATLANFKTLLGISSGFTGQGALATLSALTNGGPYLSGFGNLSALGNVYFGSSYLLEASGGAQATLNNFKTPLGTAAGISGQSAWATYNAMLPSSVIQPGANLVFDGGLRLKGQGWILSGFSASFATDAGPYILSGASSSYAATPMFGAIASASHTFSYDMGGASYSGAQVQVNWYDSGGGFLHQDLAAVVSPGTGYQRASSTFVSPAGAAKCQIYFQSGTFGSGGFMLLRRVKAEYGSTVTPFTDEATNGALYQSGQTIDALKPGEVGANVTEIRTAAAIAGQGAFATQNSAAYGSSLLTGFSTLATQSSLYFGSAYLTETSGGAVASLSNFKTPLGTAAAIAGQGAFATQNSAAYGSSLLTGFGQLASLQYVRVGLTGVSGDGIGLYSNAFGWLGDNQIYTGLGTAAGIAGQGSLATANSAAWASQITGRPANVSALAGSEVINNATLQSALTGGSVVPQTASGITGQGAFATFNQIALNTTYIKMADGTTMMTESLVKTSIGIASGFSGQGDLATQNKNAVDFTAGKIAISSGMLFVDAVASTVPLRSSSSIRSTWDVTDFNTLANRTVVAGAGSWAVPVFGPSSSYSFKNDTTSAYDINMRVRTGTVRFKARASALVYGHLSIWYRINSTGAYTFCAKTTNTWTDDMNISVEWLGDITLAAGDYIQFYVGICDAAGALRNGTFRNFTGAQCVIEAVNW